MGLPPYVDNTCSIHSPNLCGYSQNSSAKLNQVLHKRGDETEKLSEPLKIQEVNFGTRPSHFDGRIELGDRDVRRRYSWIQSSSWLCGQTGIPNHTKSHKTPTFFFPLTESLSKKCVWETIHWWCKESADDNMVEMLCQWLLYQLFPLGDTPLNKIPCDVIIGKQNSLDCFSRMDV